MKRKGKEFRFSRAVLKFQQKELMERIILPAQLQDWEYRLAHFENDPDASDEQNAFALEFLQDMVRAFSERVQQIKKAA
jgi:hypothetical protein